MITTIKRDIYKNLKKHPRRLLHVNNVMLVACTLAKKHGVSYTDTYIASLAHDYAKYGTLDFNSKYVSEADLNKYSDIKIAYHAIAGANYFKEQYQVNKDIYLAIRNHIFGRPEMSKLEKIVFISDSVNLTGEYQSRELYLTALKDLNKGVLQASIINYKRLKNKNLDPHKEQVATYEYYKKED